MHPRPVQRRKQRLLGADPHRLTGRGNRDRELLAVDDRRRGEPLEVQLDVVAAGKPGSDRRQHRRRTACVDGGAVGAVAEQFSARRQAADVVGADLDPIAEPATSSTNGRLSRLRPA